MNQDTVDNDRQKNFNNRNDDNSMNDARVVDSFDLNKIGLLVNENEKNEL